MTVALPGDDWIRLQTGDAAAYNQLYPRYNANIDFARENCAAKPAAVSPPK